jgi:hypothetical protein
VITNVPIRDDPRYRRWVVATTCGELAGFTIPAIVGATATGAGIGQSASTVLLVLAGVGEGTILGWAQSQVLRRELPELRTGDWIRATAAGAAAAWTIGMLPSTFHAQLLGLWPPMLIALGTLTGVLLLASIGFAQWLVLRRHVEGSGSWIVANALAWIAGLAVVFAALGIAPGDSPVLIAAFGVVGGLGMGLTVALITGLFLVRLLDRAKSTRPARRLGMVGPWTATRPLVR